MNSIFEYNIYKIGIDIGSTTAKMVVLDKENNVIATRYERHNAKVKELIVDYLSQLRHQIRAESGERQAESSKVVITVTGSVGMATADLLKARFIQEVVAAAAFTRKFYPEAKSLIDIGGEDSKVVLFEDGHTQLRMNGNCAGGTGAFIDQMAALLGCSHGEMNEMAMQSTTLHTIAARCGVFAKTDVQNLISRNVDRNDIAASIFHSIAIQTVTTLAHGCDIQPPIVFCGGPLTFLPALRKAFADCMSLNENQFIVSEQSNLIPAMGCAISTQEEDATTIDDLIARMQQPAELRTTGSLTPLFLNDEEHDAWKEKKRKASFEIMPMQSTEDVIIGIDSGSTTTKITAIRPNGDVLFCHYAQSLGTPVKAAMNGLVALKEESERQQCKMRVVGSCSTGYGEDLMKAAFGLDYNIVETMAHYVAARKMNPDVSFILDIGGQDMKAIFVEKGAVTRMELNEACSSGCGTFLQTFANNLGYSIEEFVQKACKSKHPCNLGSRCTVFMNSKVKQVLREGADISDIAAGLAYSVVNNCLFKVLKLADSSVLGENIVVQGGTMRNDAVVKALEITTGCEVSRSSMPEMMGAYGCALHAAENVKRRAESGERYRTIDEMLETAKFTTSNSTCKGCENRCAIVQYHFNNKTTYYSGNKCERIFHNGGVTVKGQNVYTEKYRLLFELRAENGERRTKNGERRVIGVPRVLGMYENFPFWNSLLSECGFQVMLSSESTMSRYEAAIGSVMSDNICFPAKLVHSHIAELNEMGVSRILFPYAIFERQESKRATNSYNCPIVSAYSDVVKSAMKLNVPLDSPVINFSDSKLLKRQISNYLHSLNVPQRIIDTAFAAALKAQNDYVSAVKKEAERIAELRTENGEPKADSGNEGERRLTILLAGRPYHSDPLVQHRLSDMIASLGVNVISEDIVRDNPEMDDGETNSVRQWAYINRIIKAAQWVATQPADVQFVEMTSFGCGPDSFIQDEIRALLNRYGKPLTLLKIDDITSTSSLKLRVRSLVESLHGHAAPTRTEPFISTPVFNKKEQRTILAPFISEFVSPLIPPILSHAGYKVETLPPSDEESAVLGLRYAHNEVCYPATLIVGDIIKALQSGKYDRNYIAIAMTQTGGQCRATNYAGLIKRAMVQSGFGDVPFLPVGVTTTAESNRAKDSMDIPWMKIIPMFLNSLLFADTLSKLYYPAAVRERTPGLAAELRDRFIQLVADDLQQTRGKHILDITRKAAQEFDDISIDKTTRRVGIVGEIFLKFNHFANQFIAKQVMKHGMEVAPPLIAPFFTQELVNMVYNKKTGLTESRVPLFVIDWLSALTKRQMEKFNRAASAYRYYSPMKEVHETWVKGCTLVSPAAQFGEGWLLPGDIMELADDGVKDVISLQPFGCIANHIVAKGVEKALGRMRPDINLLNLDFDSGVSQVNVTNRLLLFLERA